MKMIQLLQQMLKIFMLLALTKVIAFFLSLKSTILKLSTIKIEKIEEKGVDKLLKLINEEFMGWPILKSNEYNETSSLLEKLIRLKKVESSQIFEIYVSTNPKDPTKNVLRV